MSSARTRRWIRIRFAAAIPAVILWGGLSSVLADAPGAVLVDRVAASVNDVAIPESTVRRAMVLAPLAREAGESDGAFRGRVLDELIDQQLQYEEALRFGPEPPNAEEIDTALTRLRERLRAEGKDSAEEFSRAGMTVDDVRASLERQLVVQKYLRERFRLGTPGDEDQARAQYEEHYVPEQKTAGQPVLPFEQVADAMRARAREAAFDEEVDKWLRELRDKARIRIYPAPSAPEGMGRPVPLPGRPATAPTRTPR